MCVTTQLLILGFYAAYDRYTVSRNEEKYQNVHEKLVGALVSNEMGRGNPFGNCLIGKLIIPKRPDFMTQE